MDLQEWILKYIGYCQGQIWSWQALGPAWIDFEACRRSPGPDLEVTDASIVTNGQLGLEPRRGTWKARRGKAMHDNAIQVKAKQSSLF